MPFETVDQTLKKYTTLTANTTYDYDLARTPNGSQAYGLSVQAIYANTSMITASIQLQSSNDGTNFVDLSGLTVSISSDGSTIWDLGTPNYHYLRVKVTVSAGSMDLTLKFHAINEA